jgi:predicted dehydrogenase
VWNYNLQCIEIYGSEGSLSVPDPNTFGGPVRVRRAGQEDWKEMPLTHSTWAAASAWLTWRMDFARGVRIGAAGSWRTMFWN